eukprot:746332-Hanusia_phi.AAC.2
MRIAHSVLISPSWLENCRHADDADEGALLALICIGEKFVTMCFSSFVRPPGTKPATAQWFRCQDCTDGRALAYDTAASCSIM